MLPVRLRSICLAAGLFGSLVPCAGATSLVPSPADGEVWVTMDESVFATVTDILAAGAGGPGSEVLPFLPRLVELEGVVLTTIPVSGLAALAERIHLDLRRCGGFVKHESLAEAREALARLGHSAEVIYEA